MKADREFSPRADATIRQSADQAQARLAAIVETSDDAIISKDLDSIIRSWNAGARRLFGYTAEEAIGQPITMLMPPDRIDEEAGILWRIGRGESIDHYETVRRRKDGTLVTISLTVSPIIDEQGRVVGASKIARDITGRKHTEEALRASEAKYRTLFESIDEGFCIVEVIFDERDTPVDYRFLELNPAFERQTGLTDARGRTMRELAPDHEKHWFEMYGRIARTGEPARFELPAAGLHRWYDVYAWRYGDPDRGQVAVLFNDVTARKQAEAALRAEAQRKDDFLAMLSHELRNPLAPIRNAVSLLQEADDEPLVRRQARAILDRQVGQLVRLVDDLLDIARISRGNMDLQKTTVRLDEIVAAAVETSRPLIEAGRHRLEVSLPPETILLSADRVRLVQVIANLLNNAAKYTPACGLIQLTARPGAGGIALTVRDNGYGIEPQLLAGVFEMFVQADSSRRVASGGLGIGLALARRLVELHGGSIEARSEGAGRGSEFIVRVPLSASAPVAQPTGPVPAPEIARSVLVVDDNVDAAQCLAMLLRKMGHRVQLSYDGAAAIETALREPPEIVLLDLDMPRLDGFAVATRLRADRRFDRVPIVALTGFGQDVDRTRARQAGFDEHVLKPVDAGALRAALETVRGGEQRPRSPAAMPG
jgi:PAS domain S-box-containing protein